VQLQAIFPYAEDLLTALRALRGKDIEIPAVHSPFPHPEIAALMRKKDSPVRYITLCGAILGVFTGLGLSVYTAWQWKFVVSGKPPVPMVPYVIEAFEFCILFGVLFNVVGMLLLSRLPKRKLPAYYDARVTEDRFSLLLNCPAAEQELIRQLLHDAGAEEIHALT
jgi:molybdopterin-containing oxidoreductase family membrane subunit